MPSREELTEFLEQQGAAVRNSVTKKTSLLIIGDEPGATKIASAQKNGVSTISWPMFVYLGLHEPRGEYRLSQIPLEIFNEILLNAVISCEVLYAKAISLRSARLFGAFLLASAGVESLLRAAWDSPQPDSPFSTPLDLASISVSPSMERRTPPTV